MFIFLPFPASLAEKFQIAAVTCEYNTFLLTILLVRDTAIVTCEVTSYV